MVVAGGGKKSCADDWNGFKQNKGQRHGLCHHGRIA